MPVGQLTFLTSVGAAKLSEAWRLQGLAFGSSISLSNSLANRVAAQATFVVLLVPWEPAETFNNLSKVRMMQPMCDIMILATVVMSIYPKG